MSFSINGVCINENEKRNISLPVAGTDVSIPVTVICGKAPGRTAALTAGVHGGEYVGIETAARLAENISPEDLTGTLVIARLCNPHAFYGRTQYVNPADGENLNRMFLETRGSSESARIAGTLTDAIISKADFYIDMHGGDLHEDLAPSVVYPVCGTGAVTETSLAAARSVGIECVIGAYGDGISICRAASIGVPAILIELGGCGRWSEDQVAQYLGYMKNVLGRIGILPENGCAAQARLYTRTSNVQTSECDGFWYPRLSAGAAVKKGELVGVLKDAFGQVVHSYKADESGTVMYVVTSLAINEGAPLYSILTSGCEAK